MATQANLKLVQELYVAYYGRPADKAGLNYWAERVESEGLGNVINSFGASEEFDGSFGELSNADLVNNLYQQTFGRDAEQADRDYWIEQIENGSVTLANAATSIASGARNDDAEVLQGRVQVADKYTEVSGENYDVNTGKGLIQKVSSEGGDIQASIDSALNDIDNLPTQNSFTLTEAIDAQELPEGYTLTDATVNLGVLAVAGVADAQANAQAVVDGAVNAGELTLEARYTIEDTAANLTEENDDSNIRLIDIAINADRLIVTEGNLDLSADDTLEGELTVELAGDSAQSFTAPDKDNIVVNVTGSDADNIISANGVYTASGYPNGLGDNAPTLNAKGGAGNDVFIGGKGSHELVGGNGYDFVSVLASGRDNLLFGGERTEQDAGGVYAESASSAASGDELNGSVNRYFNKTIWNSIKDANVFQGGGASDTMVASTDKDVFYYQAGFEQGEDTIHQFNVGEDFISAVGRDSGDNSYKDFLFVSGGAKSEAELAAGSNLVDAEAAGWTYEAETQQLSVGADNLMSTFGTSIEYAHDITIKMVGVQNVDENTTANDFFASADSIA